MTAHIPAPDVYGETGVFPDVIHCEAFSDRAPSHGWLITPHRHARMAQMFVVAQGGIAARVDRLRFTLPDQTFLFVPQNAVHDMRIEPGTQGLVLSFPAAVLQPMFEGQQDMRAALAGPICAQASMAMIDAAFAIHTAVVGHGPFRALKLVASAQSLLCDVASLGVAQPSPTAPVSSILHELDSLIARHIPNRWRVTDYAKALSISPGHLSRLCRKSTGMGAAAYVETQVMAEACRLLAFTRMSVAEAGYRVGFEDPSHFSKRFRAHMAQTPQAYRNRFAA